MNQSKQTISFNSNTNPIELKNFNKTLNIDKIKLFYKQRRLRLKKVSQKLQNILDINIQENNYINRIKDLSKWNLIMGDYKFNLCKLPQIQIVCSNLKAKHHGRNTLSPQPKARLFLCIEKDENNSENTLDIINQELLDKDQFRSNIICSKDNMKVNRDLLTRLMSRYTQKRSPFQEYKEMTNNKFSQINTSLPRKSEKKEEQKYKLISSFQPKVKDLSGRTKCHPRIRLLNRREIEIRTKILSTIMSEGDLNSIK